MRDIEVAVITDAILHRITRVVGGVELVMSETTVLGSETDTDVLDYLAEHVRNSLTDNGAIAADLESEALPVAHALEQGLSTGGFVTASQNLARHLYEHVQADGRISDGTLAVVQYRAVTDGQSGPLSLGLLKLDPSVQYTIDEQQTPDGIRITLKPVDSVLPSVSERLQKAAFLGPRGLLDYRLVVLDRQTPRDEVASWFMRSYLGAKPATTGATLTDAFYRAVSLVEQELENELDDGAIRRVWAARDQALRDQRIDIDAWVENRRELSNEQKGRATAILREHVVDPVFTVDQDTAEQLLKRARFEGDDHLVILLPVEFEDRVGQVQTDVDGDRFVPVRTSTLRRTR